MTRLDWMVRRDSKLSKLSYTALHMLGVQVHHDSATALGRRPCTLAKDIQMQITKQCLPAAQRIPLIAALPYRIVAERDDVVGDVQYDPMTQLTRFAGRRDFSTSREDESAGGLFSSKSDTKKDD